MRTFYTLRRFFRINAVGGLLLIILGGLLHAHDSMLLIIFGVGVFAFGIGGEVACDEYQRRMHEELLRADVLVVGPRIFSPWDEETAAAHADHDELYGSHYRD
jgi:hypothetical protein